MFIFILKIKKDIEEMRNISKTKVKVGDRVELVEMNDTMTSLKKGSKGTVKKIDEEQDMIWVEWDNGEELALLTDFDRFKIIK